MEESILREKTIIEVQFVIFVRACLLQVLVLAKTVLLGVGQIELQVIQVLQDLLKSDGPACCWSSSAPSQMHMREAIFLEQQELDMLPWQLIVLYVPVPQADGGELVPRMAGLVQHHLYYFLTGLSEAVGRIRPLVFLVHNMLQNGDYGLQEYAVG